MDCRRFVNKKARSAQTKQGVNQGRTSVPSSKNSKSNNGTSVNKKTGSTQAEHEDRGRETNATSKNI